ncbi:L-serine ammonia-lyase [Sulfuriroseicoccus oceanibius]|uniref:L-serine dehydratase n=1 Tax=Sulfuriroseicoccus oceanibius TaxID=2707525 RepID=A0A6B3L2G5_9BACT|nr:L-serine ammonia-lyase [Sulfuriroseicoccus oceanibius]QQL46034.1 L-serine ammonia-lyase [Sulfuriroseicoccus oceanibius]
MYISVFELFSIGIGPSSSHTVGPMRAAVRFLGGLAEGGLTDQVARVRVDLYGSLALTGKGHGTDTAVLMGLEGSEPETIDPRGVPEREERIRTECTLKLGGERKVLFNPKTDLQFLREEVLDAHPNGMRFIALDGEGAELFAETYYSVGGGFVVREDELETVEESEIADQVPYPFDSADELLAQCAEHGLSIDELMMANECALRSKDEVEEYLDAVWTAMQECVQAGLEHSGTLPGGLKVPRRAASVYQSLLARPEAAMCDPLTVLDWVNLYALAVNEENAAGGRVVTAPTNGAAGIIPAVLHYATRFQPRRDEVHGVRGFLLTSAAIGSLYKKNASISGADVGCQGEVGVACSMAAGALAGYLGGSPSQVCNAAEIGMEHNLGLTCDPIGGLVQIPCIERNAMGSVKAINAARIAMRGDGHHIVSLDKVIRTMLSTGRDMMTKYKETARGGLAVNVVEC